jgi:hypothetical protein
MGQEGGEPEGEGDQRSLPEGAMNTEMLYFSAPSTIMPGSHDVERLPLRGGTPPFPQIRQ